jgi:hypothetical protein
MKDKTKYNAYILSLEWQEKRKQVFDKKWYKCEACWISEFLHIHHWTYIRLYKEKLSDLFVLCGYCHMSLHDKYWTRDLFRATKAFIKWEDLKQKKKRTRMSLEERRKNRQLKKELEIPMAIRDIKNWVRFSKSSVTSLKNWKAAIVIIKNGK